MSTIFSVVNLLLNIYAIILLLRIMTSWMRLDPYNNEFVRILYALTEPVLEPIRAVLPPAGMFDFSPLVATILIIALQQVLSILASGR